MTTPELISAAVNALATPGVKTSDVLMQVKIIGHYIESQELMDWANLELNGYAGSRASVPSYRKINVLLKANLIHKVLGPRGWRGSVTLDTRLLPDDLPKLVSTIYYPNSISELEQISQRSEDPIVTIEPWMVEGLNNLLYKNDEWFIYNAWQLISLGQITGVLTAIRSKALDLVLKLDKLDKTIPLKSFQSEAALIMSKTFNSNVNIQGGIGSGALNISTGDSAAQAANTGSSAQLSAGNSGSLNQSIPVSLSELVQQLKEAYKDPHFDGEREEINQEIQRVEAQLQKAEPKKSMILRAFESLRELTAKGMGTAAGHAAFELLKQAPDLLDNII